MLSILNLIIFEPLKLLFEVVFHIANFITNSCGISIVILSLTLNIVLMPLYKKADDIQELENETQKKLKPGIDKIKKAFKGDEQYMILQTYYRQNNYKPIYSLRSITSLLLEIPFFIAAYNFLSNITELSGTSFLIIKDLSMPDGLLAIGNIHINIIPILMTIINVISCAIYTKGQPFKSKIQLYLMALVFLVLLYNAPAGLSFYYLLNNLFSLIKNIFSKLKHKNTTLAVILSSIGIFLIVFLFKNLHKSFMVKALIVLAAIMLFVISFFLLSFKKRINYEYKIIKHNKYAFFICTIILTVLVGLLIPSQVISASPEEFIDTASFSNPLEIIFNSFLLSFGAFVLWFNVYYSLMNEKVKRIMEFAIEFVVFSATINHLFFKNNLGLINNELVFDLPPSIGKTEIIINLLIMVLIFVVSLFINNKNFGVKLSLILLVSFSTMFAINAYSINKAHANVISKKETFHGENAYMPLSKTNKNVVVIMLDRAVNTYFPYLLDEKPELQEQFSGFTYYPNTVSFGRVTNIATPSLFGGYEYTPEEMNKRNDELLVDKQNEALKVMPVLFNNNGYDVTVYDPPYAGYDLIPDLSIYDDYPNIKSYITENRDVRINVIRLRRNLFCYGIARICPSVLFHTLYNSGNYMSVEGISGVYSGFIGKYNVLSNLREMTFVNEDKGSFIMFQNSTTHQPIELQLPDYTVVENVDNSLYEKENTNKASIFGDHLTLTTDDQINHYHVNMISFLRIGEWLDYLRDNGIYDNTRIIIASDHTRDLHLNPSLLFGDYDYLYFNPILLVKDFNSEGFNTDSSFMTLADVPYLALNGVIENPVNPFTNKPIEEKEKANEMFHIFASSNWDTTENNGTTFINDDIWFNVHDDCLNPNNWSVNEELSNK